MKGRKTWWAKSHHKKLFIFTCCQKKSICRQQNSCYACFLAMLFFSVQINWSLDDSWLSQVSGGVRDGFRAQAVWSTGSSAWGRSPWSWFCQSQMKTGPTLPWAVAPALDLGPESPLSWVFHTYICGAGSQFDFLYMFCIQSHWVWKKNFKASSLLNVFNANLKKDRFIPAAA